MSASSANDLSELLSNVKEKIDSNTAERKQLADSLRQIAGEARSLLTQMGESQDRGLRRRRRPAGTAKRGPGRPKGSGRRRRTMSPEARAKIAAAQKRRWAAVKAGERKK